MLCCVWKKCFCLSGLKMVEEFLCWLIILDGFGCNLVFSQVHGGCAAKRLFVGQGVCLSTRHAFRKKKPKQRLLFRKARFWFSYPLQFPSSVVTGGNCRGYLNQNPQVSRLLHGVYLLILQIDSWFCWMFSKMKTFGATWNQRSPDMIFFAYSGSKKIKKTFLIFCGPGHPWEQWFGMYRNQD